jgi:hypothetical protein
MKTLTIVLVVALVAAPLATSAQRGGGRAAPSRGFDMHNDVPTGTARGRNGAVAHNQTTGNTAAYNRNTNTATTYNKSTNTATQYHPNTSSSNYNKNSGAYNGANSAVASDNRTARYVMTSPAAGRRNPARGASYRATFPPQSHVNLQG